MAIPEFLLDLYGSGGAGSLKCSYGLGTLSKTKPRPRPSQDPDQGKVLRAQKSLAKIVETKKQRVCDHGLSQHKLG